MSKIEKKVEEGEREWGGEERKEVEGRERGNKRESEWQLLYCRHMDWVRGEERNRE